MKRANNRVPFIAAGMLAMLLGWAPGAIAATAEERAACEQMAKEMGLDKKHSHLEDKGQGSGPMNLTHARCKKILAEPSQSGGNSGGSHGHGSQ